jgi:hypothetical protein
MRHYLRIGGISLRTSGYYSTSMVLCHETQPSAADLLAIKAVLIVFLFTFAPALCVAQPDSARDLDFPSRIRFTCQVKVHNAFLWA